MTEQTSTSTASLRAGAGRTRPTWSSTTSVTFPTEDGALTAVSGLTYSVGVGKTLGIVGESGSGKSVSSMAVLGLHDTKSTRISGSIRVGGTEVIGLSESRMRKSGATRSR